MPSIRYYNQTAPFWDFVAGLEDQGTSHPFFSRNRGGNRDSESDNDQDNPWGWGRPFAHRERHGPGPRRGSFPPGPPPPFTDHEGPSPPADGAEANATQSQGDDAGEGPSNPRGPHAHPHHAHGFHGSHGPEARRGPCGGRRGGWGGRHRGGWGGPGGFGVPFNPFNMAGVGEFIQNQFESATGGAREGPTEGTASSSDFKPLVDVFDTETSFVVHISLPGAKKEDVGVNWDAEKSELSIGGVIYRPGDEDFLKTLALDERKEVGAFERKIRLGSRANPAQVDADAITAKLEDGILRVDVPKLDKDYVEIKKVDIE
ncbi:MAG: hypothetical protein M1820_008616 [Bogoriella megaspora]|nr:MAG: hypothetical protein M1820_008616 [Bogoriella megaspora]